MADIPKEDPNRVIRTVAGSVALTIIGAVTFQATKITAKANIDSRTNRLVLQIASAKMAKVTEIKANGDVHLADAATVVAIEPGDHTAGSEELRANEPSVRRQPRSVESFLELLPLAASE